MCRKLPGLHEECWERVFQFLHNDHHRYLEPLSLVSKQFLSITNRLRLSLTVMEPTLPFLSRLLHRFPSLTSLDLTRFRGYGYGYLQAVLLLLCRYHLCLKSLKLPRYTLIPTNALRAFSKKFPTLISLDCYGMTNLGYSDFFFIADCFPVLEELDISYPWWDDSAPDFGVKAVPLAFPKLRKVNLCNSCIDDSCLFRICKNCRFLQELSISCEGRVTEAGITSAIRERPGLISLSVNYLEVTTCDFIASLISLKSLTCLEFHDAIISDELLCSVAEEGLPLRKLKLNNCKNYTYHGIFSLMSKCHFIQHLYLTLAQFLTDQHVADLSMFLRNLISIHLIHCSRLTNSAFFALARTCPLLNEIEMSYTKGIGKKKKNSLIDCSIVKPKPLVKRLCLSGNKWLTDASITMFASICPNVEMLDLSRCDRISKGVVEVLRRCPKIKHLDLKYCEGVKLYGLDFQVPNLEVLELSGSRISDEIINDEELIVISKCCPGLYDLDLVHCNSDFSRKGVREVVDKCTKLKDKYGELL